MRQFIVYASTRELAETVGRLVVQTGYDVLFLDATDDPQEALKLARAWKASAVVMEEGLQDPGFEVPVITFRAEAVKPEAIASAVLSAAPAPPAEEKPLAFRAALGFQGIKGGVGTTTIACAVAAKAAELGLRTVVLDLAGGDCIITLRGKEDEKDRHLYVAENGIVIVAAPGGLLPQEVWDALEEDYDLIVVDAGRAGENRRAVGEMMRRGVRFFLVATPACVEDLERGAFPGYEFILNRHTGAWKGFQALFPEDPDVTGAVNRGEFGKGGALLAKAGEFLAGVLSL